MSHANPSVLLKIALPGHLACIGGKPGASVHDMRTWYVQRSVHEARVMAANRPRAPHRSAEPLAG